MKGDKQLFGLFNRSLVAFMFWMDCFTAFFRCTYLVGNKYVNLCMYYLYIVAVVIVKFTEELKTTLNEIFN